MFNCRKFIISLLIGLLIGLLTLLGQKVLPPNLNFLANSGAVWMIPAFLVSFRSAEERTGGVIMSVCCLLGCVLGYYISEVGLNDHAMITNFYFFLWLAMALPAGMLAGLAGWYGRKDDSPWQPFGRSLISALFFSEGGIKLIHLPDYLHMVYGIALMMVIGAVAYFLINGRNSLKVRNLLALTVLTALGLAAHQLLYLITS
jgi:hypothetical protein